MRATILLLLASLVASQQPASQQPASQQPASQQRTCPFECFNDSVCAEGEADFSDHPTKANGDVLDIHIKTQINGLHCACHPGYTGLYCKEKFEDCADYDHKCYNGGKCILGLADIYGNDQLFCDCSEAFDEHGVQYVGKYCEVPKEATCDADGNVFCVNGGWCKDNYQKYPRRPCNCGSEHDGPHCEFDKGSVPNCTLECENGGVCRLGIHGVSPGNDEFLYDFFEKHSNYQYCECPPGSNFKGARCELESNKCGDHHCFHGGECVTATVGGVSEYQCDCTRADSKDTSYAGRYCQYEANNFCDKVNTENGLLFCVNDGVCHQNGSHLGCICPSGFHGPICEFKDADLSEVSATELEEIQYENCTLQCANGGQCRNGIKDTSFLDKFGPDVSHLNQAYDENFEHCVCPESFVGLTCEHQVETCPGGQHACFHGSSCIVDGSGEAACDCQPGFTAIDKLAGKFCEHQSTTLCTESPTASSFAFCVNNGVCVDIIEDDNLEHPGCSCSEEFYGPHCEFLKSDADQGRPTEDVITDDQTDDEGHPINNPGNFPQEYLPEDKPNEKVAVPPAGDPVKSSSESTGGPGVGSIIGVSMVIALVSVGAVTKGYRNYNRRKARQIEAALREAELMHDDSLTFNDENPQQRRKKKYRDFLAEYDIPDMDNDYVRPSNSYHDKVFENVDIL